MESFSIRYTRLSDAWDRMAEVASPNALASDSPNQQCTCFQCNRPPWLVSLKSFVQQADRPLTLSLPCVGLSAPAQAAKLLGFEVRGVEVCDLEVELQPALQVIHAEDQLCLGKVAGDITKIAEDDVVDTPCDGLVSTPQLIQSPRSVCVCVCVCVRLFANVLSKRVSKQSLRSGPPCPPVSSIGQRQGDSDCRAEVFYCVVRWVIARSRRSKQFAFFVLENPNGVEKRKRNETEALSTRLMNVLRADLAPGWVVTLQRLNLNESGYPASRPRVFIVGTSAAMRATPLQRRLLNKPVQTVQPIHISTVLSQVQTPSDWELLSQTQQLNVLVYLQQFREKVAQDAVNLSSPLQRSEFLFVRMWCYCVFVLLS